MYVFSVPCTSVPFPVLCSSTAIGREGMDGGGKDNSCLKSTVRCQGVYNECFSMLSYNFQRSVLGPPYGYVSC